MFYIYAWANRESGKVYVGQTTKPARRRREHSYRLCGRNHQNTHLQRAWALYGESAFDFIVISEYETKAEVDEAERFYIAWYRTLGLSYNKTSGGEAGFTHDDETREKIRQASLAQVAAGKKPPSALGKKMPPKSDAWRQRHSEAMKGRDIPPEARKKQSDALRGKPWTEARRKAYFEKQVGVKRTMPPISDEHREHLKGRTPWNKGKAGAPAWNKGIPLSQEQREAISQFHKGRKRSPESVEKQKATVAGRTWSPERRARFEARKQQDVGR